MRPVKPAFKFILILISFPGYSQKPELITLNPNKFDTYNISLKNEKYKGKESIAVQQSVDEDNDRRYSIARLKDVDFHNGSIEVTLTGETKINAVEGARGFVGIAFRIPADTSKMEVIYLRPTNGRSEDQFRRNHSTQYVSYPGYTWQKLRKEFPDKYESYVDIVTGEWTKVKIEIIDEKAKLYVNGADQPCLLINDLKQGKDLRGSIGLWVAIGTIAHYTDLKITKYD